MPQPPVQKESFGGVLYNLKEDDEEKKELSESLGMKNHIDKVFV